MSATQILNQNNKVDEAVSSVYYTNDLEVFKFMEGNRHPNPQHISRIAKSMEKVGLLMNPIIVNKDLEVVDGQHRFLAAKQVGLGIYYIIAPEYRIEQVHALNENQKSWTIKDFIYGYAEMGNSHYQKLVEFMEQYSSLNASICVSIASGMNSILGGSARNRVKIGEFTFSRDWHSCVIIAESIDRVRKYFSDAIKRSFVGALLHVLNNDKFDLEKFIYKCEKYPTKLYKCVNIKDCIEMIESVYNYRSQTKVNLRF